MKKFLLSLFVLSNSLFSQDSSSKSITQGVAMKAVESSFQYTIDFECFYQTNGDNIKLYIKPLKVYNVYYFHKGKYYEDLGFLKSYDNRLTTPLKNFIKGKALEVQVSGSHGVDFQTKKRIDWNTYFGNYFEGKSLIESEKERIRKQIEDKNWDSYATVSLHKVAFSSQISLERDIQKAFKEYWKEKENEKIYFELEKQIERETDIEKKISLLEKAKSYTKDNSSINDRINQLRQEINSLNKSDEFTNKTDPNNLTKKDIYSTSNTSENKINSNGNIKKRSEYTKEEFANLTFEQQQESNQLEFPFLKDYNLNSTSTKQIDKELQMEGNQAMASGDYAAAYQAYDASGDNISAITAGGAYIVDLWSKGANGRKKAKIAERDKNLKISLNDINSLRKESQLLFNSNQYEEYFRKELIILDKELFAIFQALLLSRKSKTAEDENLVKQMEKDFKKKTEFLMRNKFINGYQKLRIFYSFAYYSDELELNKLMKNEFLKLDDDTKQFLIYDSAKKFMSLMGEHADYMVKMDVSPFGQSIAFTKKYFDNLDIKFKLALEGSLDYHFYLPTSKSLPPHPFQSEQAPRVSFEKFCKRMWLKETKKYLKQKIKMDKAETGKTYEMLLEEKNQ
ncbi:hypothetical protein [Winogradskyella forsetii]|uniref:hypothetical protein n=1 Tax=Winogradskyella forsetii TaxID=2686077 RepID=UPI0015C07AC6|nr:hypothetical protein [Winogradskyella forsetii]